MKMKDDDQLKILREDLDSIDDQIAKLILKRLEKSALIGKIKKSFSINTYTPEREREILDRIIDLTDNQEQKIHLKRIFERIIDESRAIQRKIK
jgi:chorismate mutase